MNLSVVVPCYNKAPHVRKLRDELLPILLDLARTHTVEVVLVDDGSTDDSWQVMYEVFEDQQFISVRFARHEVNRGLGAALRTGYGAATGDVIVIVDSDGTYRFSQIPAILDALTADFDIVTASLYHPAGGVENVPGYQLVLSRGSSTLYRILVDRRVHAYTSLFRVYRPRVVETVSFDADGFLAGTELMVKAMLAGFRVAEFPAVLHAWVHGISKSKLVRTILAHLLSGPGPLASPESAAAGRVHRGASI
jgi:dolichol-phosphate mannosyltransferase